MKSKLFGHHIQPTFEAHELPVVQVPSNIRAKLNPEELAEIERSALDMYLAAKMALDESIADVATHDERALEFAGEFSERVITLIDIAAELGLVKFDPISASDEQLAEVGVPKEAIEARARAPGLLDELKQKGIKTQIISESHHRGLGARRRPESRTSVELGNTTEIGFVGFSPLAIKNATSGNLRERMYIAYKSTYRFSGPLLSKAENVTLINQRLQEKGIPWQLNQEFIDYLREQTRGSPEGLYACGAFGSAKNGARESRTEEFRAKYLSENPTVREMEASRIPLSERELLIQTGDLSAESDAQLTWLPGEAWTKVIDSRDHPSIRAADEVGDPTLTGVSGTTDTMLTFGHMLGLFDGGNACLRDGLVACLAWLIDTRGHSAYEVLTSGQTFGLEYHAGPDSYKQIRPNDDDFLEQLRVAQAERGFKMPDEYLSAKYVRDLIKERFPQVATRDAHRHVFFQESGGSAPSSTAMPADKKPSGADPILPSTPPAK
jgi:hypothetical protein